MTVRLLLAALACLAVGCEEAPPPIAPVAQSGELVVLTVNGPSTYFEDAQGHPSGFEYDLATMFAKDLGVKARFIVIDNPADVDRLLRERQAHLAAAELPRHFDFPGGLAWGPSYFTTQHEIVGRASDPRPRNLEQIAGKRIGVIDESVGDYLLSASFRFPVPIVRLPPGASTADLLQEVADGHLDYALVESNRFTLARRFFPQIDVAFTVGRPLDYAWLVSPVDKRRILAAAQPFFERLRRDGTLKRLVDRYYGHAAELSAVDSAALIEKISSDLPKLKPYFEEAERVSGIDWRLIAAVGYQESHWDPLATSPTGVRGLMMLTDDTADQLQLKDRLDARESILGGARYLARLRDSMPLRIPEPDRTFLALGAYNQGAGHLEDARILAQRSGLSPDKWQDVRQVLPKLADPATFQTLQHGYARGFEAQRFVDSVRNYYAILERMAPRESPVARAMPETPLQASSNPGASGR
ncbi:MAG TPA: membrane-bound lytic murein transglycosylase MltF [Usitatibacter sp.]|nr:membrane-bound lytic murein transglycosylase MltF [Usitatibacter sp.]